MAGLTSSSARRQDRPSSKHQRLSVGSPVSCKRRAGGSSGVLTDNGNEFGRREFGKRLPPGVAHTRIRSGRPQTNGHVERLHRTILEECWRPAFARFLQVRSSGLRRHLSNYLDYYNNERAHTGRHTAGQTPADLVYGAKKMEPK